MSPDVFGGISRSTTYQPLRTLFESHFFGVIFDGLPIKMNEEIGGRRKSGEVRKTSFVVEPPKKRTLLKQIYAKTKWASTAEYTKC